MVEGDIQLRKRAGQNMAKINPSEFIRQVRSETSKIVWPTREETIRTAIFVALLIVVLSLFFLLVDSAFGWVVQKLISLA
jgi:preprotein translocase subunit SecE